jgi:hypothetical protein
MFGDNLTDRLASPLSRRTVVRTGVKLGYAAPLIAASFKLTAEGGLAQTCTPPAEPVGGLCCSCATTVIGYELVIQQDGTAKCVKAGSPDLEPFCVQGVSPG